MYARVNIIFGTEDKVGPGVAHIEKSDRYVVEAAPGNRGLTTLVDRKTGVIVAISYWDDLGQSSEARLTKAREDAAEAAGGALITENFEIAVAERLAVPDPGATCGFLIGPRRHQQPVADHAIDEQFGAAQTGAG